MPTAARVLLCAPGMLVQLAILAAATLQVQPFNARALGFVLQHEGPRASNEDREIQWRPAGDAGWRAFSGEWLFQPGETYEFRGRYGSPGDWSEWVGPVRYTLAALPAKAPEAPHLRLVDAQRYSLTVAWDLTGFDAMQVDARESGAEWRPIAVVPAAPGRFTAHILKPGRSYQLRARAWNQRGASEWSGVLRAWTLKYRTPRLTGLGACVTRQQALDPSFHNSWDEDCLDPSPQEESFLAGKLDLLLVDPIVSGCHGNGGTTYAAFAELGGCLRSVGDLAGPWRAMEVDAPVAPIVTYWHMDAGHGTVSVLELRGASFVVADSIESARWIDDLDSVAVDDGLELLLGVPGAADFGL